MKRGRILTGVVLVAICGLGLTLLMAAKSTVEKAANAPPEKPTGGKRLVCMGDVSTADRWVDIFPENYPQPSRVLKVLVPEGADVTKGQPLLEFDTEMLVLKVQEAEDGIRAAKAKVAQAEAGVRQHKILVNASEKKWKAKQSALEVKQSELKEARRLADPKIMGINQLQLEAAIAAVNEAEFNLEAAQIEWEGLKGEEPSYLIDLAKADQKYKETLKLQAEHARDQIACKAPADGKIIRSFVSEGQNFGPTTREPAFWFLKKGPLLVRAEVTQEFARRIVLGQNATIQDEADSQQVWKGRVTKVGDQFLPKRNGAAGLLDFMPVSDDRVLECQISIELASGEAGPKFGQKVRVTLE